MRQTSLFLGIEKQAKQGLGFCACLEKFELKISSAALQNTFRTSAQAEVLHAVFPMDLHWHQLVQLLEHCWSSNSSSAQSSVIQGCGAGLALEREMKAHLVFK